MPVHPRILIADNDATNVQLLSDICNTEDLEVMVAQDGAETLKTILEDPPDLVLLDVMMPELDGFEVLQALRRRPATRHLPVILVTAVSDDDSIRQGYQLGADDYLTKPFEMAELLARVEALLRRARAPGSSVPGNYHFGDVRIDVRRAEVTRAGARVQLSAMEYKLLRCFVAHRGAVLSRDQLLDEVWGQDSSPFSRTVDVHVALLRQKLEVNPSHPEFIVTVHRLGYRFDG